MSPPNESFSQESPVNTDANGLSCSDTPIGSGIHLTFNSDERKLDFDNSITLEEAVLKHKEAGNKYFSDNKLTMALEQYSLGLQLSPRNAILYANRSAVNLRMENFGLALEDANTALSIDPAYIKPYYRRGSAYFALERYSEALKDFRKVCTLAPKDRNAREKLSVCSKTIKRINFEAAIASEREKPLAETLDVNSIVVPVEYDGPKLPNFSIGESMTVDFVEELKTAFINQKTLHNKYCLELLLAVRELFLKLPNVVSVDLSREKRRFTVCGDIHGQFFDLINIFEMNGPPSEENPYLFNGDFVDRGSFSTECVLLLFAYKLLYPDHFHLARGNHESLSMNRMYGFEAEVKAKYSTTTFDLFREVFCTLPLGHIIANKVFVVHGGLFSRDNVKILDLQKIDRFSEIPQSGLFSEMLWSDPQPANGRGRSKRGVGHSFGPDITHNFLRDNSLDLLIRSHEVKEEGYEVEADGKLITVFSAPNYCDQAGNKGAFITFENSTVPRFTKFSAVPHPSIPAMAYSNPMRMFGF